MRKTACSRARRDRATSWAVAARASAQRSARCRPPCGRPERRRRFSSAPAPSSPRRTRSSAIRRFSPAARPWIHSRSSWRAVAVARYRSATVSASEASWAVSRSTELGPGGRPAARVARSPASRPARRRAPLDRARGLLPFRGSVSGRLSSAATRAVKSAEVAMVASCPSRLRDTSRQRARASRRAAPAARTSAPSSFTSRRSASSEASASRRASAPWRTVSPRATCAAAPAFKASSYRETSTARRAASWPAAIRCHPPAGHGRARPRSRRAGHPPSRAGVRR